MYLTILGRYASKACFEPNSADKLRQNDATDAILLSLMKTLETIYLCLWNGPSRPMLFWHILTSDDEYQLAKHPLRGTRNIPAPHHLLEESLALYQMECLFLSNLTFVQFQLILHFLDLQ